MKGIRKITITSHSKEIYQIDFKKTLETLIDVIIEKTNYSMCSGRMDADLAINNGGTMINSNGEKGEKETSGKRASWIDFYGNRGEKMGGMAIL